MNDLIFSLNATMPVFFVMALGWALGRIGFLPRSFCTVADKLVFKVTLPVMLFCNMAQLDLAADFSPRYVLFCAVATTVLFFGIWGGARLLLKDKALVGEFVQACYRSSAAILGVAFITNMYGNAGMAPLMILGSVPLFNIYAVIVLTVGQPNQAAMPVGPRAAQLAKGIATNPIILGILAGTLFAALPVTMPVMLQKTLSSISALTTPLALLSIGAAFEGAKAIKALRPTLVATAFKLVLNAALVLPVAVWLGFRNQQLIALLVMLGSPATPTCYVMAKNMGHEGVLSASCVAATTLLSALTLTGWIFILRHGGYLA